MERLIDFVFGVLVGWGVIFLAASLVSLSLRIYGWPPYVRMIAAVLGIAWFVYVCVAEDKE